LNNSLAERGVYRRMPWSQIYRMMGEKGFSFAAVDEMTLLEVFTHLGANIRGMGGLKLKRKN